MSFDLEAIRSGYAELTAEFGENGAAILAGVPIKFVESALNGEKPTYTERIESLLLSRPKAYEFYQGEQRELFKRLEWFIVENGSAKKAASAIGASASTISDIRNCKYRGDIQQFFVDFASYLTLKNEKKAQIFKAPDYVPTSVSEYMYREIFGKRRGGHCELCRQGRSGISVHA